MRRREVLVNLLHSCNSHCSIAQLHSQLLKTGLAHDSYLVTNLNYLYSTYTSLTNARKVFDDTPHPSAYLWTAMLRGYSMDKQWEEALSLFRRMLLDGKADSFSVQIAVKACVGLRALECGKVIHGLVKKDSGIDSDMFVRSLLIKLYSKCGEMAEALKVYEDFADPDVVQGASMVTGYEQNGQPKEALAFFARMVMTEHADLDPVALVSVVSACTQMLSLKLGGSVHGFVIRRGFHFDMSLANSLLNFYGRTGSVKSAARLFGTMQDKDVISWSSMIACYTQNDAPSRALDTFNEMVDKRVEPNSVTIMSALQACAVANKLEEGKKIHKLAVRKSLEFEISVATSLIDMYMKCLSPEEADDLFKRLPRKDVVTWVALLGGYALNGMACKSLLIFRSMLYDGVQPDAVAMVKILAACSDAGILQRGLCLHGYVVSKGFGNNIYVEASLIELYSKCGSLDDAIKIFNGAVKRDTATWTSMIAGYGIHGQGREALRTFEQMVTNSSSIPNTVTFQSLLSACSHAGLVKDGIRIFNMMVRDCKIRPSPEHYATMVDLFGRTGELDKAIDVINQMPVPAAPHVWGALLGACRLHQNAAMGKTAARSLFQLDPRHAGYYTLLSNTYAADGEWDNVVKLKSLITRNGLKKVLALSEIEVGHEIHCFVANDRLHWDTLEIYRVLQNLELQMRGVICS